VKMCGTSALGSMCKPYRVSFPKAFRLPSTSTLVTQYGSRPRSPLSKKVGVSGSKWAESSLPQNQCYLRTTEIEKPDPVCGAISWHQQKPCGWLTELGGDFDSAVIVVISLGLP
jgi:hypothetical protein